MSECAAYSFDILVSLAERVSGLERHLLLTESGQVEGLESLSSQFETLKGQLSKTEVLIAGNESGQVQSLLSLREGIDKLVGQTATPPLPAPIPIPPPPPPEPEPPKPPGIVEIPMKEDKSKEGIICYLTKKHGGKLHEKGIVTLASKSVFAGKTEYAAKNVADLTSDSFLHSKGAPGQWVSWDFGRMRIRPTHYTINGYKPKSWLLEGSLDGQKWTEIDRQTNRRDFWDGWNTASFAASDLAEVRFIRLTQTDKRHGDFDSLLLRAVEFFGTLYQA
jgi:hypothetical protein